MYTFAILIVLSAVVWKVTDLIVPDHRNRMLGTFVALVLGVAAAEALQWNLFEAWGQDISAGWLGVVFAGLGIGAGAGMMQSIARMVDALLDAEEAVVHSMEERRAAA